MKRIFLAFAACLMFLLAPLAQAQQPSTQPTVPQIAGNVLTALFVGEVVSITAIVTGNVPELCKRLQGTYTPTGPDRCPDGQWRNLFVAAPVPASK